MPPEPAPLAVVLHDVEPATYARCRLLRERLQDAGVARVTLCVVPAVDHHPFFQRSPDLAAWLRERRALGDALAQQGFVGGAPPPSWQSADHVRAGRRLLALAGLEPSGYRAPDLAHVVGGWRELRSAYGWWIAAGRVGGASIRPAGGVLRVDLHPRRPAALERALRAAADGACAVTYDDLAAGEARLRIEAPAVLRTP